MHLSIGSQLQCGKYRIEKVLGQGGFGITYLALQVGLNRKVAIKEFFMKDICNRDSHTSYVSVPSIGSKELVTRFKTKFIKEAQTIAEVDNSHIIRIYDIFEENGTAYYVMEYLCNGSLMERMPKTGYSEPEAILYIRQLCDALSYIHSKRILHLDIKPSNVLFRNSSDVVLIDFGISKHYDDVSGGQTSSTPVGISDGYAPTEQYECGGVASFSASTDIYSLGATLYCLLCGERPPKASIVLNEGIPVLPTQVSAATRRVVECAMQPRRKDRPQSIEEFLALLDGDSNSSDSSQYGEVTDFVGSLTFNNSLKELHASDIADFTIAECIQYIESYPNGEHIQLVMDRKHKLEAPRQDMAQREFDTKFNRFIHTQQYAEALHLCYKRIILEINSKDEIANIRDKANVAIMNLTNSIVVPSIGLITNDWLIDCLADFGYNKQHLGEKGICIWPNLVVRLYNNKDFSRFSGTERDVIWCGHNNLYVNIIVIIVMLTYSIFLLICLGHIIYGNDDPLPFVILIGIPIGSFFIWLLRKYFLRRKKIIKGIAEALFDSFCNDKN
ncbi:MAG: serine/threonine protein kinase [Marinifilaceae bacterium]|nr:serine/threonine protein kinase [Marinifilaceae bacterium]